MKKIIFALFLLTFSLSFSNSDIDIISKEVWRCPHSVDRTFKGLTYIKFLNEKTNVFSNYKLSYSFDKKNRPKMDLYRISDNKKLCSLITN